VTDTSLFAFGFTHHRKVRKLSDAAFRLWVSAIDHANQDGSDGVVVDSDIDCYSKSPRGKERDDAVAELVGIGLWHVDGIGRWVIHDFLEWQQSAEERAANRARDRVRMRVARSGERSPEQPSEHAANTHRGGIAPTPSDSPTNQIQLKSEGSEGLSGIRNKPVKSRSGGARPARRTALPDDFQPTEEHHARALAEGLALASELERFKSHAKATGRLMANWSAAFTTWLMNAHRFAPRGQAKETLLQRAARIVAEQPKRIGGT
jgi:hypothetical protein